MTEGELRISLRPPEDISAAVRRISDRDFGGNKSKLVVSYLRERFEQDGELQADKQELNLLEICREAEALGVPVREVISREIAKKSQEEVA